ncbi:MAG: circularly permuted type 2 ATP-grasp protein, partial [Candidatus Limnocylindria bacterium]
MIPSESVTTTVPAYEPGAFWDEMFEAPGLPRPHYLALAKRLSTLSPLDVDRRQRAADLSFVARGITFAVNQDPNGIEKIIPFDLIPRIITAAEWTRIERGLQQRVRALNLFIHDVYHEQRILRAGVV